MQPFFDQAIHLKLDRDILSHMLRLPDRSDPSWSVSQRLAAPEYSIETLRILTERDTLPATLLRPTTANGAAILYCHAHGDRYDIGRRELLDGRPAIADPLGPELARLGYTVLCIDMPGFGDRRSEGGEEALAMAALWRGTTHMGIMLADLMAAVRVLQDMPEIHVDRIGAFGLSMGATHAYWLSALDPRIAAVAHACAFANIAPLIETGAHDLHGLYMTVPGLLATGDMADVAALVAPRPQLVLAGRRDPLTPPPALDPGLAHLRKVYGQDGALAIHVEDEAGHELTARMRAALLDFLTRTLVSPA